MRRGQSVQHSLGYCEGFTARRRGLRRWTTNLEGWCSLHLAGTSCVKGGGLQQSGKDIVTNEVNDYCTYRGEFQDEENEKV